MAEGRLRTPVRLLSRDATAMPPLVIVTEALDERPAQWLGQRAELVWCSDQDARFDDLLSRAEALVVRTYTQVNESLLGRAPKLKVVGRAGVGLDNFDLPACRRHGVQVAYTPDANTQAVVEYVIGLMLDELRPRYSMTGPVTAEQFHRLRQEQVGEHLSDKTLGILGFGRIGKRLAKAAHGLGIRCLVNDLIPEHELRPQVDVPFTFVDKATLYRQSDILSIHVDGRRENRRMFDVATLAQLKDRCLLINAARGMLVDNEALAAWAKTHPQARVILDVHDPEPPPPPGAEPPYPLYHLDNVRLLPHLASRTHAALENMSWVVRDVWAVLQGEKPQFPAPN